MDLYTSVMPKHSLNEISKMSAKLEQLDEISFGLFDERYRNAVAKQNVISIRGDSMVV